MHRCYDNLKAQIFHDLPMHPLDCSAAELDYVHQVSGERWGFLRLDVLRPFPFPEAAGHFVPESYLWSQVSTLDKTRHINEQLRVWRMDAPSFVRGPSDPATHADGHRLMYQLVLNLESQYVSDRALQSGGFLRSV